MSDPDLWVPVYLPLFHPSRANKRRKILYGSRDSAKSYHIAQYCIMRMLEGKCKGLMVRKAFNSIKEAQWQTMLEVVEERELEDLFHFKVSPLEVICLPTGARMLSRGMDKSGKAKSIKDIDFAWYEEVDELDLADYTQTTLSLRGHNLEEYLSFNSPDVDHWLLKRFFPQNQDGTPDLSFEQADGSHKWIPSTDPKAVILHTTYLDNPHCNPDRRAEYDWLKAYMPEDYRTSGLGLFGRKNIGSLWLKQFSRPKHVRSVTYDPNYPVHLAFDQNKLPYSTCLVIQCVPAQEDGRRVVEIRVVKEICLIPPKNSSEEVCDEFIYLFGHTQPVVYVYGDPSGISDRASKQKGEAKSHYHAIEQRLRNFLSNSWKKVRPPAPSIKGRQRYMEVVLAGGTHLRLVVDPSCKNMIGDFEHLVEDENGGFVKKVVKDKETGQQWEERGHCMDAFVYFASQCYPKLYRHVARA